MRSLLTTVPMYPAGNLFIDAPHWRLEAIEKYPGLPVTLAGFSFGARVGLEVGTYDERVRWLVGVGTPVSIEERDYDFSFLRDCRKPLLLVHGERDEFGAVSDLRALAEQVPPE